MRFLMNFLVFVLLAVVLAVWVILPWPGAVALAVLIAAWLLLTRRGRQAASVDRHPAGGQRLLQHGAGHGRGREAAVVVPPWVVDLHDESLIWLLPYREVQKAGIKFKEH